MEVDKNTKHKIRQPYPNKNWFRNDMKYGRKILNGYVLMFNTFEELDNLLKLSITWSIKSKYEDGRNCNSFINIIYDLKFNKDTSTVYSICSRDTVKGSFKEIFDKYDEQFDLNSYEECEDGISEIHKQYLYIYPNNSRIDI